MSGAQQEIKRRAPLIGTLSPFPSVDITLSFAEAISHFISLALVKSIIFSSPSPQNYTLLALNIKRWIVLASPPSSNLGPVV